MKNTKWFLCVCVILATSLVLLSGCGKKPENGGSDGIFSPSADIDENGFWEDVRALEYVELFNYKAMPIPNDIHQVTDDDLQYEINNILADYSSANQITDREIVFGDTVNIDYVGSVDGVEFSGGSTGGMGTDVTAGSTEYIDDFLTQIIGHMPGETINVEVTFPDNYGQEELNGKDAIFVTTLNYITEYEYPELTDDFIEANLYDYYTWKNVDEMKTGLRSDIQKNAIQQYVRQYLTSEVVIKSVPGQLMTYQENSMLDYYQYYADMYEMELEEFVNSYVGFASVDELIAANYDGNLMEATYGLVLQAIAEDAGLTVSGEDLTNYFIQYVGTDDYSSYEEQYGLPYLKQVVLYQRVLDYIVENAILT